MFDSESDLFWYADLSVFDGYTYPELIGYIDALPGDWRMATLEEWTSLTENGEEDVVAAFVPTRTTWLSFESPNDTLIGLYTGRIDEPMGPSAAETHKMAQMAYDLTHGAVYFAFDANVDWNDEWDSLGAWVVTERYPAIIPESSALFASPIILVAIGLLHIHYRKR